MNAREWSGRSVMMALVMWGEGGMKACGERLRMLLAQPDLDLLAEHEGATAEQWARRCVHAQSLRLGPQLVCDMPGCGLGVGWVHECLGAWVPGCLGAGWCLGTWVP